MTAENTTETTAAVLDLDKLSKSQRRIMDAVIAGNGEAKIKNNAGNLASATALAKREIVAVDTDTEDGEIFVSYLYETTGKGERAVWPAALLGKNADGEPVKTDENGLLVEIPTNFPNGFAMITKKSFANTALYHDWRAFEHDAKAAAFTERAAEQTKKADECRLNATEAREGTTPQSMLAKIRARREAAEKRFAAEEAKLLAKLSGDSVDDEDVADSDEE